jgi:glycosyltransferase involved in cell wall biosynthesis
LPTRGENFGHVFLEAWSAGVPVLVSDQTPWRGLESLQVGWDIPLDDPEQFVRKLELAARLDIGERSQMRKRCLEFARAKAEDKEALALNRHLFSVALSQAPAR